VSLVPALDEPDFDAIGKLPGVTSGIVTQNTDPDALGRVKLRLAWRDEGYETGWARVAAPMAGAKRGAYFLPEVGDEVLVAFDRGDIRFPYVLGSLWSREDKPPETNDDGKNAIRVIHTRRGHKLLFDDSDKGRLVIELSDGKSITIDDDGILIDDKANKVKLDAKGGAVSIEAKQALTLKAPKISIEAGMQMEIKGGTMLNASAAMVKIN
jgi:uncharacterized protein involved in type VI secretion and phage assembly